MDLIQLFFFVVSAVHFCLIREISLANSNLSRYYYRDKSQTRMCRSARPGLYSLVFTSC